ncbi:Tyrosine recombinase XerC [subsurface metagenome]
MATPKTLTAEECCDLLRSIRSNYITAPQERKCIRNYTIALLMLDAGLRVGEVVKLQWYALWYNTLPVTSIIIRPEIAKNKTERIIPVSERLSNAIKKLRESCGTPDFGSPKDCAMQPLRIVFPLTTRQVERIIRAAAMKALGRPIHPHVLRHTFASRLMRTTSIRVVQELLGHKQMSSTQIYTHPNSEDLKNAIDTMDGPKPVHYPEDFGLPSRLDTPNRPDTPRTDRDM